LKKPTRRKGAEGVYSKNRNYRYAGTHLLLEFWGAKNLNRLKHVERALADAVKACGATLLDISLHHFSPYDGVSGVAVIKESHISIHTWPEFKYAAIDIFTCGRADPHKALPVLTKAFCPKQVQLSEHRRGIML